MQHTKFQGHRPVVPEKKIFKRFYYLWAWRSSWSCDLDHMNKLSFPHPKEASIGPVVSEEKIFKMLTTYIIIAHQRTTEAYLYYKLPNELAFAQV